MIAKAPNNPPFERKNLGFHALVGGPSFALMPSRACSNVHLSKLQKKNWMVVYHTICSLYPFIHNNGILQFLLKVIFFAVFFQLCMTLQHSHDTLTNCQRIMTKHANFQFSTSSSSRAL